MLFLCQHKRLTTPRRDDEGLYQRCLDCAARIPWGWTDDIPVKPPTRTQEAKPRDVAELERLVR